MERRGKGSGNVMEVPCRRCGAPVAIDATLMQWGEGGRPVQVCPECGVEVPLRHADAFRAAPNRPVQPAGDG